MTDIKIDSPFCACNKCVPASWMKRTLLKIVQTIIGLSVIGICMGLMIGLAEVIDWAWNKVPASITPIASLFVIGPLAGFAIVAFSLWGYEIGKNIWRDNG